MSPICKPYQHHDILRKNADRSDDPRQRALTWRVADGGYFDNDGIVIATKWAQELLVNELSRPERNPSKGVSSRPYQHHRFKNIVILRILAFPESSDPAKHEGVGSTGSNLLWDALGPVLCLNAARGGAQVERSTWETKLLADGTIAKLYEREQKEARPIVEQLSRLAPEQKTELDRIGALIEAPRVADKDRSPSKELVHETIGKIYNKRRPDRRTQAEVTSRVNQGWMEDGEQVEQMILRPILHKPAPQNNATKENGEPIRVWWVVVRPPLMKGESNPPLSWKLTPKQKKSIRDHWEVVKGQIVTAPLNALPDVTSEIRPDQLRHFFTEVADLTTVR